MGSILYSVDEAERTHTVCQLDDALDIIDRANGIGGIAHRHNLRTRGDLPLHLLHIERAILWMEINPANMAAAILRNQEPGGDIGIVIEARHHQFVARLER